MVRALLLALRVATVVCGGVAIWNLIEYFMYGQIASLVLAVSGGSMSLYAAINWWHG